MLSRKFWFFLLLFIVLNVIDGHTDIWENVGCNERINPPNCNLEKINLLAVEDFERCGPAKLSLPVRNYFLGAAGRRITVKDNKASYKKYRIVPKVLRDVSVNTMETTVLGKKVSFPIGLSPIASQKLVHPEGEIATVRAVANMGTIMILSGYSSTTLEEVEKNAKGRTTQLWMQTYIFRNQSFTEHIVKRAEKAGFDAIVVTVDSPVSGTQTCDAKENLPASETELVNLPGGHDPAHLLPASVSFDDISWLKRITKLPIVAKGVLSASDAKRVISSGASAILVSNHGGRQLDSAPATIDVLPGIARAAHDMNPNTEVYVDGGIRNGWDVYKAIARGAKVAFVGRPIIWGLALQGGNGVREVMNILQREFNETMLLAGSANPSKIRKDSVISADSSCEERYTVY